jgi:hypothetical protein
MCFVVDLAKSLNHRGHEGAQRNDFAKLLCLYAVKLRM